MWRNITVLLLLTVLLMPVSAQNDLTQVAQVRISPTPVNVIIPTSTPPATEMAVATATPTYTPTPEGPAVARAIPNEFDQEVNVRALPDPTADVVGTLEFDTDYVVTGQYFSWWQIEFSRAPGGRGYVFESVVDVTIGTQPVPEIDPFSEPTPDPQDEASGEGDEGAVGPDGRVLDLPTPDPSRQLELDTSVLPTFTPPPDLVVLPPSDSTEGNITPTPDLFTSALNTVASGGIPPIVPIGVLAILGTFGMMIAIIRR